MCLKSHLVYLDTKPSIDRCKWGCEYNLFPGRVSSELMLIRRLEQPCSLTHLRDLSLTESY